MKLSSFPMQQVRLLDGPFLAGQETNRQFLHSLDMERLLKNFRVNAGLPAPGEALTGWEAPDCEIRGHFVGHFLSGLALAYASSGDETLKEKGTYFVGELAKVQQALGGEYLSAFPESHWDRVEAAQQNWAQYYTIHKMMAGLLDQYTYCRNQQALDVLKGMASYFKKRLDKLSQHQMDKALSVTEEGGISEALWNLYAVTNAPDHRQLAAKLEKAAFLGPLALEHDNLSHIHGNTHIPLAIGAARHYELTCDDRYKTIARYFWDRIAKTRSYATGGTTLNEVWPEPNKLADALGYKNQECCKTYNMLKLTRHLFCWTGELPYADFYERALFNSILGTQESEQGRLMYYIPLGTGYQKSVLSHSNHFYCCNGTGIESSAKFNDSVYFHDDHEIYVNLFIASSVEWPEKGIRLEQQTRFPEEEGTTLLVHAPKPVRLALHVRVPSWATQAARITVNGQPVEMPTPPGAYARVEREWKEGDKVEVRLPMSLHAQPMPDDGELMAFLYGPIVLAGITMPDESHKPYIIPPGGDFPDDQCVPNHDFFLADVDNLDSWMKPVSGQPLTFRSVGQAKDMTFVPFYRITGERYGVYWIVTKEGSPKHQRLLADAKAREERERARRLLAARKVDEVAIGNQKSETAHNLQGEGSAAGSHMGKRWRHAERWWSWRLAVLPDTPMALLCTYWGSDVGRTFDVLIDDHVIATEKLENRKPGQFVEVEYAIPPELTKGKESVTVKFQATGKSLAGGVFECLMLKP